MPFEIVACTQVRDSMAVQTKSDLERLIAALEVLSDLGPNLGRPLVDSITGSRIPNLKELRLGANRILFCFSSERKAKLLIAGNKKDRWVRWYQSAIPEAEQVLEREFHG